MEGANAGNIQQPRGYKIKQLPTTGKYDLIFDAVGKKKSSGLKYKNA
jgi:hypothetical protein